MTSIQNTYTKNVYPGQPQYAPGSRETIGDTIDWSYEAIRNLESINNYAILDSIVVLLLGNYNQIPIPVDGPQFNTTLLNGTKLQWNPVEAGVSFWDRLDPLNGSIPTWFFGYGGEIQPQMTMIKDTLFNVNRDNWADNRPRLNVTEKLLNEMVANVTIATMLGYYPLSTLNQTVPASLITSRNEYSFSRPINLILPYTLSLVLSIPFLVVGYISHRKNGTAATSDSFIQLLLTVTRSEELDRIATLPEYRDNEMKMKELKQTKIMFGEIVDPNGSGRVRRMGFGLKHEVVRVGK